MGCFYVDVIFMNIADRTKVASVANMAVDTGSECTWVPRRILEQLAVKTEKKDRTFVMANGQQITRMVGYAIVQVGGEYKTVDEVVFAEEGDLPLLGARSLEGLNVTIDPQGKRLVAAGPVPAAGSASASHEIN